MQTVANEIMASSAPFELFALGTPVMDGFAQVGTEFLAAHKLAAGSSNFMDNARLAILEKELGGKMMRWDPGDNGRNVCESFARLQKGAGARTGAKESGVGVAYAGSIGTDEAGSRFLDALRMHGIQPFMQHVNGSSGRILALITPEGQRTFAVALGVSEQYRMPVELPKAEYFFITSITALTPGPISHVAWMMLDQMRRAGSKIAIAFESPAMLEKSRSRALELAAKADVLFLNEEEMKAVGLDEAALAKLAPLVYLKRGANGSVVFSGGSKLADIPSHPAKKVVDTTGAGDNFAAGALWGLAHGKDALEAAKIGGQLGAAAVSKFGASLPVEFRLE